MTTSPSPTGTVDVDGARTASPSERWPELRPIDAKVSLRRYFRDMWQRRDFAIVVPLGDLRARNQDTFLGQLWHLMNPLLLTLVYWLVFGQFVSRGMDNYLAFLIAGVIPFQFTSKSVTQGARLIHGNRSLIQSIHFPRALLPFSAVLGELIAHATAILVMVVVMLATGVELTTAWLLVVPIVLVQALFNLGLALVASRLTFHFRDIQNILPYLLRLTFYMSGIIFSIEDLTDGWLRDLLHANPINAIVRLTRMATLEATTDAGIWLLLGGWTVGLLVLGFLFFRAAETEYGRV